MVAYKYLLKVFYNKTNKKEYKLKIWQYNLHHTNIIETKDIIVLEKNKAKEKLSTDNADIMPLAKVA